MTSEIKSRLLYTRRQVAELLGGCDVSTVRRLEKQGRLKAVRLTKSATGMVYFRADDVIALVAEAIQPRRLAGASSTGC
jgi:DNA-binding transcriptional MerR regulator